MYCQEDFEGYAYGRMIDATADQKSAAMCEVMNERSRRHFSMTEAERKADDYELALEEFLQARAEREAVERARYVRHWVAEA